MTVLQKGPLASDLTSGVVMLERSEASQGGVQTSFFTFLHLGQAYLLAEAAGTETTQFFDIDTKPLEAYPDIP